MVKAQPNARSTRCTKCELHKHRHFIIHGRGDVPADVLFIGDAPTKVEDLLGKAFVGVEADLLNVMRKEAGIDHLPTYFINCVFCRCPTGEPSKEHLLACSNWVTESIDKVNPKHIVLVGNTAQKAFKSIYKHAIRIVHPAFFQRIGGERAPGFRDNVIKLQQGIDV